MKALLSAICVLMGSAAELPRDEVFLRAGPLGISREGYDLILKHEVGGGAGYYNRYLKRPTWPGASSGVTIGIGYDLGYNSREQIARDWHMLSADVIGRLQSVSGVKGAAAKRRVGVVRSIVIPWDHALEVYEKSTVPRFAALTARAYPEVEKTHPHVQGVMLSWVFNRGSGISPTSARDREKRAIRTDIGRREIKPVPGHIRSSKRLWVGKGVDGLLRRREDEALLVEASFR